MKNQVNITLKEIRKKRKKTQKEIAKVIHISESAYRHYESGRCRPSTETLLLLADYYEISMDILTGRYK